MNRIFNESGLLLLLLFLLNSCFEDKGNYDYKDINEISISGLSDQVKYTMKDSLIVIPRISPEGKYSYQWTARRFDAEIGNSEISEIVIGEQEELHYLVKLPQGTYSIELAVTDENSTLEWSERFKLIVSTPTSKGWIFLCNSNGRAQLNMVEESTGTRNVTYDILGSTSHPVRQHPKRIMTFSVDYSTYEIFMLADEGCTRLVSKDLSWGEANDFRYLMADPTATNVIPTDFAISAASGTLMVADGDAYWRKHQGSPLFSRPVNNINGQRIPLAPFIANQIGPSTSFGTQNFVLYDTRKLQFLRYSPNDTKCDIVENFPSGYQLISMQNSRYDGGTSYAILKDESDGNYYLFPFFANTLKAAGELKELKIPELDNVSLFAFDPVYSYMYYIRNKQLWLYSYTEENPLYMNMLMLNALNGKDEITMLKYNINGSQKEYLMVGSVSAQGKGTMRLFQSLPLRGIVVEYGEPYTDFTKIIDVTYKEQ